MKFPIATGVLIFLLFSSLPVAALSTAVPIIAPTTAVKSTTPVKAVLPLATHTSDSLSTIVSTQKTAEAVFQREKESYAIIQTKSLGASSAEKSLIQAQLSEQRNRYLVAALNRVIVIYQRIDYIVLNLDESLLRLRVLYKTKKGGIGVPDFDSRVGKLESQLSALQEKSQKTGNSLEKVKESVDLSIRLRSARDDVVALLQSLRSFLVEYRLLVQDVMRT